MDYQDCVDRRILQQKLFPSKLSLSEKISGLEEISDFRFALTGVGLLLKWLTRRTAACYILSPVGKKDDDDEGARSMKLIFTIVLYAENSTSPSQMKTILKTDLILSDFYILSVGVYFNQLNYSSKRIESVCISYQVAEKPIKL